MSRVENLHDLFIVTAEIWLRVDDVYSFNNIYAPTPFECINRHFAKMAYEHGRGSTVQNNTSMIAKARQVYSINRRKVEI